MLQVDVFWVYGIGAMFATAAAKQLKSSKSMLETKYFSALLIYLSLIFVPEAIWLTWSFPHWETMHVYSKLTDIPTAVVVTFVILDFLIAMIGFWVAYKLIMAGREYLAHVQWFIGYLAFFFVLTNGWDCLAWQRFSWDPTVTGELWAPGKTMLLDFAKSNVAMTLYAMAVPTLVPLLVGGYIWLRNGNKLAGLSDKQARSQALRGMIVYGIGVAIALIVAGIATFIGNYVANMCFATAVITAIVLSILLLVRGSLFYKIVSKGFVTSK
ncbi:MAG: hypothetical protein NZ879_02735 [Archaeoglobaceae archaeon]|nr:hypothetical protein [Archaeoglobaceae archaeon]MDW8117881.1 hypothetical protein [Archaeoglobaceae archaeon]